MKGWSTYKERYIIFRRGYLKAEKYNTLIMHEFQLDAIVVN